MKTKSFVFACTATVWAVAAATAVFWLLQWTASPGRASADLQRQAELVPMPADTQIGPASAAELATLLGHSLPPPGDTPQAESRFKLFGVVAQGRGGAALLAIDEQPAKAYRVGSRLDENTVLQAVGLRHVILGIGAAAEAGLRLDLTDQNLP